MNPAGYKLPQAANAVFTQCLINAEPHAIEQFSADVIAYDVVIEVVSETHLKKKA